MAVEKALRKETKISMIGTLPPLKGISTYCLELAKSLSKEIHLEFFSFRKLYPVYPGGKIEDESSMLCLRKIKDLEVKHQLVYYNPFSWIWVGLTFKGSEIHVHWWTIFFSPIYFSIFLIAKLRRKKIVITAHNVLPHETGKIDKFVTKVIFSFADKIIVHSKSNIEQCINVLSISRGKLVKIPHGTLDLFKDKDVTKDVAIERLGIPPNMKIVLYFGNIRRYKGVDTLIEAFNILSKKYGKVVLVIAGKPWEDWKKYEKLIERFGLKNQIKLFLDYILFTEVKYFFTAADLVVLPYTRFSSQSGVGLTALSFHKPVIVTDVGGLTDLVIDKRFVVRPDNPIELAEKMRLAVEDEELLELLSTDSEKLSKRYSWDNIAEKTLEVYEKLLK